MITITLSAALIAFLIYKVIKKVIAARNEARYYQARYESILNSYNNRTTTDAPETNFEFGYESEDIQMARAILGIHGPYTREMVNDKFRMVAKTVHPDKQGDREVFQRLIKARDDLIL